VAFFSLLALDAWNSLVHAGRYGAGDLALSHLPALDAWLPHPNGSTVVVLLFIQLGCAVWLALGAGRWWTGWLFAGVYAATYLSSQIDSYQHHYLVLLVLVALGPFRWKGASVSWPIHLVRVQLSFMYFWAALAKAHPTWLEGTILATQVRSGHLAPLVESTIGWSTLAILVIVVEVFLAIAIQLDRWRALATVTGVLFHLCIEWAGYKIGLFSWLMVAMYLLVAPTRWFDARWPSHLWHSLSQKLPPVHLKGWKDVSVLLIAIIITGGVVLTLPLHGAAVAAGLLGLAGLLHRDARAHLALGFTVWALAQTTDVLRDHHKYIGGDARRRGHTEAGIQAYEQVVAIDPNYFSGQVRLGDFYRKAKRHEDALECYRRAQALQPDSLLLPPRIKATESARRE